jgi:glycosyltransferase involved in cell wall biosynthesis
MKIVFLMTRLSGYFFNTIRELCKQYPEAEIKILAYPKSGDAPFQFEIIEQINIQSRENFKSCKDVFSFVEEDGVLPNLIYVAGWKDELYRKVAKKYKSKNLPVVLGMDNQWKAKIKQKVLVLLAPFTIKRLASHIMVPGLRQYDYARKLGFKNNQIIRGLYSADTNYFWKINRTRELRERVSNEKNILFIGNMWEDKGVIELVNVFNELTKTYTNWNLTLIGGGILEEKYKNVFPKVNVAGFVQPNDMKKHLTDATVFCLPSYHDAWAVVIHEAACIGIPIVATAACGAIEAFVFDGYNGFICEPKSEKSLKDALMKIMVLNDEELEMFGERSLDLSKQITPQLWVNNLMRTVSHQPIK